MLRIYLVILLFYVSGCKNLEYEISRIKSPNSELDVVLMEHSLGATESDATYLIYIVPSDSKTDKFEEVFHGSHIDIENLEISWKGSLEVEIKYVQFVKILHYQNYTEVRVSPAEKDFQRIKINLNLFSS